MQSSNELYVTLKDHVNENGLPIIPEGFFQILNEDFTKEVFPTPGAPTKHKMGPFIFFMRC